MRRFKTNNNVRRSRNEHKPSYQVQRAKQPGVASRGKIVTNIQH